MLRRRSTLSSLIVVAMIVATWTFASPASATVRSWTGGGGSNSSWSNGANWAGGTPPASGDSVSLSDAGGSSSFDDLASGTVLAGISFTGTHSAGGSNEMVLTGGILSAARSTALAVPLRLADDIEVRSDTSPGLSVMGLRLAGHTVRLTGGGEARLGSITGPGRVVSIAPGGPITSAHSTDGTVAFDIVSGNAIGTGVLGAVTMNGGSYQGTGRMASLDAASGQLFLPVAFGSNPTWSVDTNLRLGGSVRFSATTDLDGSMHPLAVGGEVRLDGPALDVVGISRGNAIPVGTVLTVIDNRGSGAVVGTFADLPEGSYITTSKTVLRLSYAGGDGNDTTLTSVNIGYASVTDRGSVNTFGTQPNAGSVTGATSAPIVDLALTPSKQGYWLLGGDGGIFTFGDAGFFGSTGDLRLNLPVVGMARTPSGNGYWLVAGDGGIFSFGDAGFFGSTGNLRLNAPILGMASTPSGNGYWLFAADGGIFTFGDAVFFGSTGSLRLNKPVVTMTSTPTGGGYWLTASDGGVFTFGDAGFFGSTGDLVLNKPIVDMAPAPSGRGYWFLASDGGIFTFGDAPFLGSSAGGILDPRFVRPYVAIGA